MIYETKKAPKLLKKLRESTSEQLDDYIKFLKSCVAKHVVEKI
jgi:hypothetical protein